MKKEFFKKEKCDWFKEKPKKKQDWADKSLKLAGGAVALGAGLAVLDAALD